MIVLFKGPITCCGSSGNYTAACLNHMGKLAYRLLRVEERVILWAKLRPWQSRHREKPMGLRDALEEKQLHGGQKGLKGKNEETSA